MPEPTPIPDRLHGATLARLQAALVTTALLAVVTAWVVWHDSHPQRAALISILVGTGHAWVLGLECVLAAWVNRHDAELRGSVREWLQAWWHESRLAPQVFAWRQPWRWRQLPDSDRANPTGPAAVVLVHGFVCNRAFWQPWMRACRERGIPYVTVNLEPVFGPIDDCVPLLEEAVRRAEALTGRRPTLVCHSMGGLVARAWLASAPAQAERVQQVITIGSPHRGTWLAHFSHLDNGRQMRPEGPWLADLAQREAERGLDAVHRRFVCWFANTDNIVFPAATATLPGADNRLVRGAAHVDLAFHPRVMHESLSMLASAGSSPSDRTSS